jgi:predicted GNAT family acetyltransferase
MNDWPEIDYRQWRETCAALQLYLQIAGKYRLAHTPWLNHSWHATFYVNARGWTSSLVPDGPGIEIAFDLIDHRVVGRNTRGGSAAVALRPMSVAAFHAEFVAMIAELGGTPSFHGSPNEIPDPVPFAEDDRERRYDAEAVTRFFRATVAVDRVFKQFRTSFIGKSSPVHLFWGSFDLAVTRFSGRPAPLHPGGIPALPDAVAQEAYDHEVASAGFWPGGGGIDYPAFYAYAYPTPPGYAAAAIEPEAAFWSAGLGEFILPYDAVRTAADPEAALLRFLTSSYAAAADLGGWDRQALECEPGVPRRPRAVRAGKAAPAPVDRQADREEGSGKGRYRLSVDGHEAVMTYSLAGEHLIIIDHTEVPDALRGRRIGESLVRQAVEDARAAGKKILPLCPFAKAQMDRHPEWKDVLSGGGSA